MKLRRLTAMISTINDYSVLKWPLAITAVLVTIVSLLLLLSFCSNTWFKYETTKHTRLISRGSFGLWEHCDSYGNSSKIHCNTHTRETRPQYFSIIVVLISCALFLINLTFFPAWVATIFVLYNASNRYIPYIIVSLWIMFLLTLATTAILICALMFIGSTSFYSPGKVQKGTKTSRYSISSGLLQMFAATLLAIVCLTLVLVTLIWKKFIDVKLHEDEKELYKQLNDDNFQPGWHKIIRIPRKTSITHTGNLNTPPPPYQYDNDGTVY
ncbi:unnamed protein product [Adineta steineri]|uniref:Uncharacterized protein n=1 Tax=Adineta steineri TaxID=433720 RepID=A0A815S754_9BILA|nr:unnamed protein product [Adineta steineri]CAF1484339.1 unnamed protein product [Adineta steineri]CAF1492757.1 unnamed protein product [Adineta steineri]CAF1639461.1 unnamed protein product [Adineta steineri]